MPGIDHTFAHPYSRLSMSDQTNDMNVSGGVTAWQHFIDAMLAFSQNRLNRESLTEIIIGGLDVFQELPGSIVVSLFMLDEDSLDFHYSNSLPENSVIEAQRQFVYLVDKGVIAAALNSRKPIQYTQDRLDDEIRNILVMPLIGPDGLIGLVLVSLEEDAKQFEYILLRLCELHSYQFASMLHSARTFRRLLNEQTVLKQRNVTRRQLVDFEWNRREKARVIGTFARFLSHDLSNIFNNILGFTRLTAKNLYDTGKVEKYNETIKRTAKRGGDLAAQLKDLLIETRRHDVDIPVAEVLRQIVASDTIFREGFIQLSHTCIDDRYTVKCTEADLNKIIQSVIGNIRSRSRAVKAKQDEPLICISSRLLTKDDTQYPDMLSENEYDGDYLEITVSDNLPVLPKDSIQKVFEPYAVVSHDAKKEGLQLAVAYALTRRYGGTVTYKPLEVNGNIFRILLQGADRKSEKNDANVTEM